MLSEKISSVVIVSTLFSAPSLTLLQPPLPRDYLSDGRFQMHDSGNFYLREPIPTLSVGQSLYISSIEISERLTESVNADLIFIAKKRVQIFSVTSVFAIVLFYVATIYWTKNKLYFTLFSLFFISLILGIKNRILKSI